MSVMTPTADGGSQFDPRPYGRVELIGRVIGSRTVAILALHIRELWSCGLVGVSGRQEVTHRMAGETRWIGVLMRLLEWFERVSVRSDRLRVVDLPMAFLTDFRSLMRDGMIPGITG